MKNRVHNLYTTIPSCILFSSVHVTITESCLSVMTMTPEWNFNLHLAAVNKWLRCQKAAEQTRPYSFIYVVVVTRKRGTQVISCNTAHWMLTSVFQIEEWIDCYCRLIGSWILVLYSELWLFSIFNLGPTRAMLGICWFSQQVAGFHDSAFYLHHLTGGKKFLCDTQQTR